MGKTISIDDLIAIVRKGGKIRTGVDLYNSAGVLLLGSDIVVDKAKTLLFIKKNGIDRVPMNLENQGGVWDENGKAVHGGSFDSSHGGNGGGGNEIGMFPGFSDGIEQQIHEIEQLKAIAAEKYSEAKQNIKKILDDIRKTGGEFDYNETEKNVTDLVEFLTIRENAFAYLTKEMLSFDDYLYNHSINVCAIGTAIINRFNDNFSMAVNDHLNAANRGTLVDYSEKHSVENSYTCFMKDELRDISIGYFLHDIGKVLVPVEILNKSGTLTPKEFDIVKRHSYEFGQIIIEKNRLNNPFIKNTVRYHHAPLYEKESRCYPEDRPHNEIPLYVRICKLADIYDAMTSKRCYKEAVNPINVVTDIFRNYAKKYQMLQFMLHSFVKSIGIYPPGSIMFLRNGQMAFILDSKGPIVIPFTDTQSNPIKRKADPIDIGMPDLPDDFRADNRRSIKTPVEVYDLLPDYLKTSSEQSIKRTS